MWCDTYLNLDRTLESRALREFGHRVAGPMSQDDSMRLLDDAAASRLDRPHRLIKYDEDQVGVLEKFRPYRIPTTAWLEHTAERLRGRRSKMTASVNQERGLWLRSMSIRRGSGRLRRFLKDFSKHAETSLANLNGQLGG